MRVASSLPSVAASSLSFLDSLPFSPTTSSLWELRVMSSALGITSSPLPPVTLRLGVWCPREKVSSDVPSAESELLGTAKDFEAVEAVETMYGGLWGESVGEEIVSEFDSEGRVSVM